jgi:hypothetical protein
MYIVPAILRILFKKGSEYVSECAGSRLMTKQNTDSCEDMRHRFVHFETCLLAFIDIWSVKNAAIFI